MPHASVKLLRTCNNLGELATPVNRRRRHLSTGYVTDVSLFHSTSDGSVSIVNDEGTQTANTSHTSSRFYGAFTDAERQQQQQQQQQQCQHSSTHDDVTNDYLSKSEQRTTSNYLQHLTCKSTSSTLIVARENPWKKLNNVHYELDEHEHEHDDRHNHHVQAQHITFV